MSVERINGNPNQPLVGSQSGNRTVSSTSEAPEYPEYEGEYGNDVPVTGAQVSESEAPPSDIPPPLEEGGDLASRYEWVQAELERLDELFEHQADLEDLAAEGVQGAQPLLDELHQRQDYYEDMQKEAEHLGELVSDVNLDSPDYDSDNLTNDFERSIGTDPYNPDTDRDGYTDFFERWLMRNNREYGWMDPNNADANRNGVIDGVELPDSVARNVPGGARPDSGDGILGGAILGSGGGPGGTDGVDSQSQPAQWHPPADDAHHVQASGGNSTIPDDGKESVVTVSGDVTLRRQDRNLVIETGSGTITVAGYFGENGDPARIVHLEGEITNLHFVNLNAGELSGIAGEDGYAVAGVYIANAPEASHITSSFDPFEGAVPFEDSDGERRYLVNGRAGTFRIPEVVDGKEVKQVFVTRENDDIVVTLKDNTGQEIRKFRLVGGADEVTGEPHLITFQGHNKGLLFDATDLPVSFRGGEGNDLFKGLGYADLGKGNDTAIAEVSDSSLYREVHFVGGEGDDTLSGGNSSDRLEGGSGMDILYSGLGVDTDVMLGGGGSDFIIGQFAEGRYRIDGGGGANNVSNVFGPNVQGIHSGPSQGTAVLDHVDEMLGGPGVSQTRRDHLEEVRDITDIGRTQVADQARDLVLGYLRGAVARREADYGITSGQEFDGDNLFSPSNDEDETP